MLLPDSEIERQTARKWADYSIEALGYYASTGDVHWLLRADGFRHEAMEHAAEVGDYGATVGAVQRELEAVAGKSGLRLVADLPVRAPVEVGGLHMMGAV